MNKQWLRQLSVFLFGLPYLYHIPYMARAWRDSPLDRFDGVFIFLAIVAGVLAWTEKPGGEERGWDPIALLAVALLVPIVAAAWFVYEIHAVTILGAALLWWSVLWMVCGWNRAIRWVPALGLLLLGVTSTTYWLSYLLSLQGGSALAVKFVFAGLLLGWGGMQRLGYLRLQRGSFFFLAAVGVVLLLLTQAGGRGKTAPALLPEFARLRFGGFIGREIALSDEQQRFFARSHARQFYFADDTTAFAVLDVDCGTDIHEIHPASHCLRTSGAVIQAEYLADYLISGTRYSVTEIEAQIGGIPCLVAVWYSNSEVSTGSFLLFRRVWRQGSSWRTYQVATPLTDGSNQARVRLIALIEACLEGAAADSMGSARAETVLGSQAPMGRTPAE
ncbi:MAG: hypothetical protein ACOX52_17460 [Verrucomicrobiota bacterium]|jgi:hypothetical protein